MHPFRFRSEMKGLRLLQQLHLQLKIAWTAQIKGIATFHHQHQAMLKFHQGPANALQPKEFRSQR